MKVLVDGQAARHNAGKARYDLIPPDALEALAEVYTHGAAKYAARNWERGGPWSVCFASCMRHLWRWWGGERLDKESGLPHLAHAAWNVMALLTYELRGHTEYDDRNDLEKGEALRSPDASGRSRGGES